MKKITFSLFAFFAAIALSAQENPFVNGMVFDSSSTVCVGDAEGNCDPEGSDIPLTSQVGISLGEETNEIIISDITGGLYVQGYEAPMGNEATIVVDSDNQTLTVTDAPDVVFGGDSFNATGSYTVVDGQVDTFTLTWSNNYGDAGTTDFTFNSIVTAPGVASNPTPADNATDVPVNTLQDADGNTVTSVDFAFDAPTTGDAPDTYRIVISNDITFPANTETETFTISGNFPATTTDFSELYLPGAQYFEENTTYYWTVTPTNLGGIPSDVEVWTFTTAGELNVSDFEAVTFDHYIDNNSSLVLSSDKVVSGVKLYSILGQEVLAQELNATNGRLDISSFNAGVYLAQVQIEGQTKTFKFIKK